MVQTLYQEQFFSDTTATNGSTKSHDKHHTILLLKPVRKLLTLHKQFYQLMYEPTLTQTGYYLHKE